MSYYYPQAAVQLRILPEDYQLSSVANPASTVLVNCQARDVTVNRNDYKTTDTFTMEIDYKNFPFDPRIIRACGVVIYMQDMGQLYNSDGSLNTIQPGTDTEVNANLTNAVFVGFVDDEDIQFDDTGRKVKFNGRDCTALLIDQKYAQNRTIFPNQTLDVAIKTLLTGIPALANIQLINNTDNPTAPLPVISSFYYGFGQPLGGGMNVGGGHRESYWEIIQELCSQAGLICYMSTTLVNGLIYPAIFLSTPKNQSVGTDPSTGAQSTSTVDDIKVIYGKNVRNLQIKRKLGRLKSFNIQVRARVGKQTLIAYIPREANADWCQKFGITPGIDVMVPSITPYGNLNQAANQVAPAMVFPVPGNKISTHAQLVLMGQTIFEQYSLQQLEGSFETLEMLGRGSTAGSDFDNKWSYTTYDLTQIRKGQTICLEIDPEDLSGISRLATLAERTQYLVQRNYDENVASLLASTIGKMSPRFQIKDYTMNVNQDSGFKLSVRFQNILQINQRTLT